MRQAWLVTGASRIGADIAKAVLKSGDALVATARNKDSLSGLSPTQDPRILSLDVTVESQARSSTDEAVRAFGRVDILVNNAGYGVLGAV